MFTEKEKYKALDTILHSKTFSKSTTSNVLLKFLVDSSIAGKVLSASEIGQELFGLKFEYEKGEANARVNIYHLRKKLEKFYIEEGKDEPIQLRIELGQYGVSFVKNVGCSNRVVGQNKKGRFWIMFTSVTLVLMVAVFFIYKKQKTVPFWESFLTDQENTAVVVGDLFAFTGPVFDDENQLIRKFDINSEADFGNYMAEHPELKNYYRKSDFLILNQNTPYATYALGRFFQKHNRDMDIFINSNVGINLIKTYPTVFFGNSKTMGDFYPLLNASNNTPIKIVNYSIVYQRNDNTKPEIYRSISGDGMDTDYAFVSYFQKPGGKDAFVFVSNHDIGIISAINYFTNTDSLHAFKQRLPKDTPYFTAVLKASGMERSNLGVEVVQVEPMYVGK